MKDSGKYTSCEAIKKYSHSKHHSSQLQPSNLQILQDLTLLNQQNSRLKKQIIKLRSILRQSENEVTINQNMIQNLLNQVSHMITNSQSKVLQKLIEAEKKLWRIESQILQYQSFPMAQLSRKQSLQQSLPIQSSQSELINFIVELNGQISKRDKKIMELETMKVLKTQHYQKILKDLSNLKKHLQDVDMKHRQEKQALLKLTQPTIKSISRLLKDNVNLKVQSITEVEKLKSVIVMISQLVSSATQRIAGVSK